MSDVLLINPPMWAPQEHSAFSALCPPLGLGYLAACLGQEGVSVKILDLNVSSDPMGDLKAKFNQEAPRMVGITGVTQNFALALGIARAVKAMNSRVFVVMGGPHVSYLDQETLAEPAVDAVVRFEGEQTILDLYHELQSDAPDLSRVAGISFRVGDHVEVTPNRPLEKNLDRIPYPSRHLLPMSRYGRPGTLMSSRGCPQKCIFCISSTYEGSYRPRSADNVVEELAILRHTWGIREVYLIDNVFTVDAQRVRDICGQIIDRQLDIEFHCVSRANLVTEELIDWLKGAGCKRLEIGVESGSQQLINAFKKDITLEHVREAARIVLSAGLRPMFTFQIGSPFETDSSLEETHQLAAELRAQGAITFFSIMTPYPGTPLALRAKALGIQIHAKDWSEYRTSNPVFDSQYLDRNSFRRALCREIATQAEFVSRPHAPEAMYA